jgi:hypothetical protein
MSVNTVLEAALQYAGRGWRVIPLYGLSHGVCTCKLGTKCTSPGKHPAVKAGKAFENASSDRAQIEKWFKKGGRNVGLATGRGLAVVDVDGAEGLATLRRLVSELPRTLIATTGRGLHLYYRVEGPAPTNSGQGLDIRGDGGMVVVPPSTHHSGRPYAWIEAPIATLPAALLTFFQNRKGGRGVDAAHVAPDAVPDYLRRSAGARLADRAAAGIDDSPSPANDLAAVARTIPNPDVGWDEWNRLGMAFYRASEGSDDGLEAFCQWSEKSKKHDDEKCISRWEHYDRSPPDSIGFGTLVYEARLAQPNFVLPSLKISPGANPNNNVNGVSLALPAAFVAVFTDRDKSGKPRPTCMNAIKAIAGLGVDCRHDIFHEKLLLGGHAIEAFAGDLSDYAVQMLRNMIFAQFGFDPGERNARDAAVQACLLHQFNPVTDYLAGLKWDQQARLGQWTVNYLGARDTLLHRAFGRIMLVAAVRRARRPGCKFDNIVVLEGQQNIGKSSVVRVLAGEENFNDQPILAAHDREQQEAFKGVWIHELPELAGIRRAEVERIKAFARRTEDRARPAYGRFRVDRKRQGIFVGTTNENEYLKNYDRAFWPIACGSIRLEELKRDRDQLWAEAALCEARGDSIILEPALIKEANEQQAARVEADSWESDVIDAIGTSTETSVRSIMTGKHFNMRAVEMTQASQNRIAHILNKLGFTKYRKRNGPFLEWRYRR